MASRDVKGIGIMNGMNGKTLRWILGIFMAIILAVMEVHSLSISSKVSAYELKTSEDIKQLTEWRDTWVNRVRELDATQTSSIQFLKDSLTEVKIDLRGLKAQCRTDAADFLRLLLDIRDRMPARQPARQPTGKD